jgi:uncharacterized protein
LRGYFEVTKWLLLIAVTVATVSRPDSIRQGYAQTPENPPAKTDTDPERIAAAKELMAVVGAGRQFDGVVPLISAQLQDALEKLQPSHAAEIKEVFKPIVEKFSSRKEEIIDQVAALYAQKMTAAELREVLQFYKGPVGAKFIHILPDVIRATAVLGQAWARKIAQEIDLEARKELRQRGVPI